MRRKSNLSQVMEYAAVAAVVLGVFAYGWMARSAFDGGYKNWQDGYVSGYQQRRIDSWFERHTLPAPDINQVKS